MLELIVDKFNDEKKIALVENGKLIEYYEFNENSSRNEDNIYVGTVKDVVRGMQAAFVDIGTDKNSFIHLKDILPKVNEKENKYVENKDIKDVVKVNDKLLVQVKKDSDSQKGARVSTHISLTSTYLVLMPNTNIVTISQKIKSEDEKQRLISFITNNLPKNMGAIIRTSASGAKDEELLQDLECVTNKWLMIEKKYNEEKNGSSHLIYKSPDIDEKIIIDTFSKGLNKVIVNSKEDYKDICNIINSNKQFQNIELLLKENEKVINVYELEKQIDKLNDRKIWLNCGGFITIDKTEALTAIDVNTGKFTGKNNLDETIYKVNSEATIEIAKQLRLRDIGGIVIIDYIDMNNIKYKEKIEELLKDRLKQDRAKTQVEGFTKLDLMELTRKRICGHKG